MGASYAGATVFWDDEMEPGNTGYQIISGAMAYDHTIKFSGSASVKYTYGPECLEDLDSVCGGFIDRNFPPTASFYRRFYIRLSAGFQVSNVFTKIMRSDTTGPNSNWWMMGCCGSRSFLVTDQNVPTIGDAVNHVSSFSLGDTQWYCVETYEQLNTPGVANGIARAWVNGTQVMNVTNIMYRQSGDNTLFMNNRMYRQSGVGNIWYDKVAAGDTRIGCTGPAQNAVSVPPATPTGLTVR